MYKLLCIVLGQIGGTIFLINWIQYLSFLRKQKKFTEQLTTEDLEGELKFILINYLKWITSEK